mgnify:CR=1 FL=1
MFLLQGFFILAHQKYVKENLLGFLFKLNAVCEEFQHEFKLIPSSPKSVLLHNPDIVLLRRHNPK